MDKVCKEYINGYGYRLVWRTDHISFLEREGKMIMLKEIGNRIYLSDQNTSEALDYHKSRGHKPLQLQCR